jgi:hypothetical protein
MHRIMSALLVAAAFGQAAPALSNTAANTDAAPAADAPAPKKEKLVCVRERELGSNLTTKVCQTEAQWRAEREQSQDNRKKPNS